MKLIRRFKYEILVVLFFVFVRIPDLGNDIFNTDVWKWKARSYDFTTGIFTLDFGKTYQKYHPGVTLMWVGSAGIKIQNFYHKVILNSPGQELANIFELHFIQKFLLVTTIGIVFAFCFYVLRSLFGLQFAVISAFLLSFEPFYVALTRVFHLEGLVSTFMLASALWFYYYLTDETYKKRLVISAIFGGLAFLTKTSSLYLLLFVGLMSFLDKCRKDSFVKSLKATLPTVLKWLGVSLIVFIILWPAIWAEPLYVISQLYRGIAEIGVETEHIQIYFGKLVENPGSTFYPVVLALKSSVFLLPGLVGSLIVMRDFDEKKKRFTKFLLIYSFFYFLQLTIPTKKLDRYILPSLMSLSLVSTMFYLWVLQKLDKGRKALPIFLICTPIFLSVLIHPDYLSYYNPLFGGLRTGVAILEPKWMIGERELVSYFENIKREWKEPSENVSLEELVDSEEIKEVLVVALPEKYYTQVWPFFRKDNMWAVIKDLTAFAKYAKYFVFPVWEDDSSLDSRFKLEYVDSIKKNGVPLYNVYKRID